MEAISGPLFRHVRGRVSDQISHRVILSALDEAGQSALANEIKKQIATNDTLVTRENANDLVVEEENRNVTVLDSYKELQPFADAGHLPELSRAGTLLAKLLRDLNKARL